MKKTFSVSANNNIVEEFTRLAKDFGTNRTVLISMFMVDFIKNKTIHFERPQNDTVQFESFSEDQIGELKEEGKKSFISISDSLRSI